MSEERSGGPGLPLCSVVVPVYNEAQVLPVLYRRLTAALTALALPYEIVLVDDGSSDRSPEILRDLRREDARVRYITLSRNFGHQIAISAGLDHASGDCVIVMDADLQDPPETIGALVARWREGFDVVFAVRAQRRGESIFKRGTAALFYRLFRRMTALTAPLDAGDFRLMSRRAVDALRACRERNRFVRGLASWVGFRQTSVPYDRDPRYAGETKYSLAKMVRFALNGIMAFSWAPLRLVSYAGFACALLGAVLLVGEGLGAGLRGARSAAEGASLIVAVVLFVGGLQLLGLGVIGEYLGRVHEEVRGRPLYVVAAAVGFEGRPAASASGGADPPGR